MMCKKMKAVHFLHNYKAEECLNTYANEVLFPEIDEISQWCNPLRYKTLFGLDGALLGKAAATSFLALTILASTFFA